MAQYSGIPKKYLLMATERFLQMSKDPKEKLLLEKDLECLDASIPDYFEVSSPSVLKKFPTPRSLVRDLKQRSGKNILTETKIQQILERVLPFYHRAQIEAQRWFWVLSLVTVFVFYVLAMVVTKIYRHFWAGYVLSAPKTALRKPLGMAKT